MDELFKYDGEPFTKVQSLLDYYCLHAHRCEVCPLNLSLAKMYYDSHRHEIFEETYDLDTLKRGDVARARVGYAAGIPSYMYCFLAYMRILIVEKDEFTAGKMLNEMLMTIDGPTHKLYYCPNSQSKFKDFLDKLFYLIKRKELNKNG